MKNQTKFKKVEAFDAIIVILRRIYAYPGPGEEKFTTLLCLKFSLLINFLTSPIIIGIIGQLYHSIKSGDQLNALQAEHKLIEVINMLMLFILLFITGNKTIMFLNRIKKSFAREQKNVDAVVMKYRKQIKISYRTMLILCILYCANSYYSQSFCSHEEVSNDPKFVCGTGAALRYPVELNRFFKIYMQLFVVIGLTIYFPAGIMIPIFAMISIGLIECRMQHLTTMIEDINFSANENAKIVEQKFNECIKYYAETRRLVNEMNDSIGYIFIPQYSVMALLLALLEYESIKTKDFVSILRLGEYLILEICTCTFGQRLKNQNDKLCNVLYNMAWYDMPSEMRNTFKIFIVLVQRPMHLLAKPFIVLNYEFLVKILKSSFSFMMFLQTWSKE